jgi:hypothetical protein
VTRIPAVLLLGAIAVGAVGCGSSTGPDAADTLDDYWIEGYYCFYFYPMAPRELVWRSCVIYVLSGGADGDPVTGLDVTCNGEPLQFESPSYAADFLLIQPGADATFAVSDGRDSVTLTMEVPDPPTQLSLLEGSWDFSAPGGTHTLTWENPDATADSVLVTVVGLGTHPIDVHVHRVRLPASSTQVTLSNADMTDFTTATQVQCAVARGSQGAFPGHSGGSVMWVQAAMVRSWPPQAILTQRRACLTSVWSRRPLRRRGLRWYD